MGAPSMMHGKSAGDHRQPPEHVSPQLRPGSGRTPWDPPGPLLRALLPYCRPWVQRHTRHTMK